jgi:hypothetical protein
MNFRLWESEEDRLKREQERLVKEAAEEAQQREYWKSVEAKRRAQEKEKREYWNIKRQKMYTMPYSEHLQISELASVERVPGGWLYTQFELVRNEYQRPGDPQTKMQRVGTTFVPYTEQADETFHTLKNKDY